jgi:prophage regulatory protein
MTRKTKSAPTVLPNSLQAPDSLLRLPEVLACVGVAKSTLYGFVQRGLFPAPIKVGTRLSAWRTSEVQAYIQGQFQPQAKPKLKLVKGGAV